jgi:hypothetical protein
MIDLSKYLLREDEDEKIIAIFKGSSGGGGGSDTTPPATPEITGVSLIEPDFPPSKDAADIYPDSTPASHWTEGDNLTGWLALQNSNLSVNNIESYTGTRSIEVDATSATFSIGAWQFSSVINDDFTVSFWVKTTGDDAWLRLWNDLTPSPEVQIPNDGAWHKYEYNVTSTFVTGSGTQIRFYTTRSGGSIGDKIYIDGVQVIKNN